MNMTFPDDTRSAILAKLRELEPSPSAPINLYDVGVPLVAAGFTETEIVNGLIGLEYDRFIERAGSNSFRLTIL